MTTYTFPSFATREDAFEWMHEKVDDGCVDNHRFAYVDDEDAMMEYEDAMSTGCCGCFDAIVMVDNRKATIGCHYGH